MVGSMSKHVLVAFLWFLVGWSGGGFVTGVLGISSVAAFLPGVLLAALVLWDPTGALGSRRRVARGRTTRRVVRPINEVAEELERAEPARAGEADRASS